MSAWLNWWVGTHLESNSSCFAGKLILNSKHWQRKSWPFILDDTVQFIHTMMATGWRLSVQLHSFSVEYIWVAISCWGERCGKLSLQTWAEQIKSYLSNDWLLTQNIRVLPHNWATFIKLTARAWRGLLECWNVVYCSVSTFSGWTEVDGGIVWKPVVSTGAKQEQMLPPEVLQAPGSRVVVVQGHVVQVRHWEETLVFSCWRSTATREENKPWREEDSPSASSAQGRQRQPGRDRAEERGDQSEGEGAGEEGWHRRRSCDGKIDEGDEKKRKQEGMKIERRIQGAAEVWQDGEGKDGKNM